MVDVSPESLTSPSSSFSHWTLSQEREIFAVLCRHLPAICPLDQILLDFLSSRRALLADGTPLSVLLGPVQPIITAMIHPDRAPSTHPVSRVMSEILSTFGHVRLQERLAFMFLMYNTMRVRTTIRIDMPANDCYCSGRFLLRTKAMLGFRRGSGPLQSRSQQDMLRGLTTFPGKISKGRVVLSSSANSQTRPGVRDLLIAHPEKYPFVVFSEMYSHHVTINWPYDPLDSVTSAGPDDSKEVLNPIFEKHIRRLSNWTVSREFESYYPEMSAAIFARD